MNHMSVLLVGRLRTIRYRKIAALDTTTVVESLFTFSFASGPRGCCRQNFLR